MGNMKKQTLISTALALLIIVSSIFTLQGCAKKEKVIKIGAILPLTGPVSMAGEWMKNGIELAVEEINRNGGINGKKIEVIYGDSKNQAKEGIALINKMISVDRVPVVIATMSGVAAPLIPFADKNKIVLFVTLTSLPGLTDKSEWVFRYHISGEEEAKTMAEFAFKKLGLKTLGVLYINDEFGIQCSRIFKENFEGLGGKILFSESFEKGGSDFRSILQKVKEINPPGLYILGYGQSLAFIVKQIREMGINSTILSMNALGLPKYLEIMGEAAEGAYCTVPLFSPTSPQENVQKFVKSYRSKFNNVPNFISAETYDMIHILTEAIRKGGYSKDNIRKELLNIKNFPAVMGPVTTLSNGEMIFPLTVKKIHNGTLVEP